MRLFKYQPACPQCGRKAKKHTESWWEKHLGEYKGNLQIINRRETWGGDTLTLWDGETYEMYAGNFCRNKCAIAYANQTIDRVRERVGRK